MSTVAVLITTAHADHDDAARSVMDAMRRAGYDIDEHTVAQPNSTLEVSATIHAAIAVAEPEVNEYAEANRTRSERVAQDSE